MVDSAYECNESDWPIVRVYAPQIPATDEKFQELLDWYASVLIRQCSFVMLFELGRGAPLSVERRDQLRRHTGEHAPLIKAHQRGVGIIAGSPYQRAMARALFWIVVPPCPTEVFPTWEGAIVWARKQLSADGVGTARKSRPTATQP